MATKDDHGAGITALVGFIIVATSILVSVLIIRHFLESAPPLPVSSLKESQWVRSSEGVIRYS